MNRRPLFSLFMLVAAFAVAGIGVAPHAARAALVYQCFPSNSYYDYSADTWVPSDSYCDWVDDGTGDTTGGSTSDPVPVPPETQPTGPSTVTICQSSYSYSQDQWVQDCSVVLDASAADSYIPQLIAFVEGEGGASNITYDAYNRVTGITCSNNTTFSFQYNYAPPSCNSSPNSCGDVNTGYSVGGQCTASQPAERAGYGQSCSSAPNSCGQTNSGSIMCNGACSASAPSDSSCPVAGVCAATHNNCSVGSPSGPSQTSSAYYWSCVGPNGGSTASCSEAIAQQPVNGVCAATHNNCSVGSPAGPSQNSSAYYWSCVGSGGGSTASCSEAIAQQPDLTASGQSVQPASGTVGQSMSFYATAQNIGTGAAGTFPNLVQITDSGITRTIEFVAANSVSLAPGGSANIVGSTSDLPNGSYNFRLCANYAANPPWSGSVAESNPNNNCSGWTAFTVSYPSLTGVSCSVSPTSGGTNATYTWTAAGASGGTAPYTYTWSGTGVNGKTGSSVTATYGSAGTYSASVTATDANGATSPSVACSTNGGGQSGGGSTTVIPSPSCSVFTASPSTIVLGNTVTVNWTCQNSTSCTQAPNSDGFATGGATSGSVAGVKPTANGAPYGMTCTGPGGQANVFSNSVTVLVPTASITSNPSRVNSGGSSTVTYSASNVTSCVVTGTDGYSSGTLTGPSISGSVTRTITTQTKYTISCPSQNVSSSVLVNVIPQNVNF